MEYDPRTTDTKLAQAIEKLAAAGETLQKTRQETARIAAENERRELAAKANARQVEFLEVVLRIIGQSDGSGPVVRHLMQGGNVEWLESLDCYVADERGRFLADNTTLRLFLPGCVPILVQPGIGKEPYLRRWAHKYDHDNRDAWLVEKCGLDKADAIEPLDDGANIDGGNTWATFPEAVHDAMGQYRRLSELAQAHKDAKAQGVPDKPDKPAAPVYTDPRLGPAWDAYAAAYAQGTLAHGECHLEPTQCATFADELLRERQKRVFERLD